MINELCGFRVIPRVVHDMTLVNLVHFVPASVMTHEFAEYHATGCEGKLFKYSPDRVHHVCYAGVLHYAGEIAGHFGLVFEENSGREIT